MTRIFTHRLLIAGAVVAVVGLGYILWQQADAPAPAVENHDPIEAEWWFEEQQAVTDALDVATTSLTTVEQNHIFDEIPERISEESFLTEEEIEEVLKDL